MKPQIALSRLGLCFVFLAAALGVDRLATPLIGDLTGEATLISFLTLLGAGIGVPFGWRWSVTVAGIGLALSAVYVAVLLRSFPS